MGKQPRAKLLNPGSAATLGIRLAYADIFSSQGTLQQLAETLLHYRLSDILDYLGRVSAMLFHDRDRGADVQRKLCSVFFPSRADAVWRLVEQKRAERSITDGSSLVILFDEVTVALTAKLALKTRPDVEPESRSDLEALGEALLIANGLIDSGAPKDTNFGRQSTRDEWAYYTFVVSAFTANDNALHALARTVDLFLCDKRHLQGSPNYLDLPARVKAATNLEADSLWSILFAYLAHFYAINESNAHSSPAWISSDGYFGEYAFTREQVANFLRVLARPAAEVSRELQGSVSLNAPRPYDNSVIAKTPLIEVDGRAYCPVLRLLFERVTNGLYHLLLNATPGADPTSAKSRQQFQQYIGDVFEDYVDRLIRRVLAAKNAAGLKVPLYLGPSKLRELAPAKKKGVDSPICDHLIWDGSTVVVLDSKAKFLPLETRVGLSSAGFVARFGDLVEGAAVQLDETAKLVRSGHFANLGIDPREVQDVFPAIISLAEYPIQPPLYKWIQDRVRTRGLLQPNLTRPLEIVMASDLEQLEHGWSNDIELGDVLQAKHTNSLWACHSVHNYIALGGDGRLNGAHSVYLESLYLQLAEHAEKFLRDNMADTHLGS